MRRTTIITTTLALLMVWFTGSAAQAADEPHPVNYNFLENAAMYGAQPSAPGQNIWSCKPTEAHPRPVVLVHGTAGSAAGNWGTLSAVLANAGYCVFALTYGENPALTSSPVPVGGMNKMEDSAVELDAFVDKVLKATGTSKVDLVGHSQGTLMPAYYAKFLDGAAKIDHYVSLAPVWHGGGVSTLGQLMVAGAAYGFKAEDVLPIAQFGPEVISGSPFMNKIREGGAAVAGVRYTNIVTKYDEVVVPYTSGIEPGMKNVVLQDHCAKDYSDHLQIPSSPNAIRLVQNALDPAHAEPVECRRVLPVNGFVY
ncbi:lipase (class 2) [Nocardioides albertanoniae]|uniref:Lipase (Class 2) n=1 Tax=Nocardioides albertanoniae TaxID=1175486 RepID=A0A543A8Q6_9ACTN|nr:alpha/beta fold hydrolase [Nocardioides albertanoniae]TQL68982.1 lipase (class 2) [Nocardioides albertanoniae]